MPRDGVAAESGRDLAGNECHGCRPTALERNVQQVDLRALLQHLHHEVMLAAVAYRAISEGRIGAPGVFDEFGQRLYGERRIYGQHHLRVHQARHRREILQRVDAEIAVEMRADDDLRIGTEQQREPVRRLGGHLDRKVAVRPGLVLHHDRLAEQLAQPRRDDACHRIGRAARRIGHQDAHGTRRELGVARARQRAQRNARG